MLDVTFSRIGPTVTMHINNQPNPLPTDSDDLINRECTHADIFYDFETGLVLKTCNSPQLTHNTIYLQGDRPFPAQSTTLRVDHNPEEFLQRCCATIKHYNEIFFPAPSKPGPEVELISSLYDILDPRD